MPMELSGKMCVPCEGGVQPLGPDLIGELLRKIPGWRVSEDLGMLSKRFRFTDFAGTMSFVNQMAALAEEQGHHPDFCVKYDLLDIQLSTHAIHGLSENDFIMAAKLETLASSTR
jgi:4a-hydroxytetrahydrobiopterin dehydratase